MLGLVSIPKVNFLFSSLHSLLRLRSYTHPFSLARTTDSVRACADQRRCVVAGGLARPCACAKPDHFDPRDSFGYFSSKEK